MCDLLAGLIKAELNEGRVYAEAPPYCFGKLLTYDAITKTHALTYFN